MNLATNFGPAVGLLIALSFCDTPAGAQATIQDAKTEQAKTAEPTPPEAKRPESESKQAQKKAPASKPSDSEAADAKPEGPLPPVAGVPLPESNPVRPVQIRPSPSPRMDSLRLDVGGSGLILGAPPSPAASGGTALGALPEFPRGVDPAAEENIFPDVEMRRRVRPDLLPEGPNATEEAAAALQDRIRFRSVKTQALRDKAVRESLEASVNARSDRAMREALRKHYRLLFERMRELDPSLSELISAREFESSEKLSERLPR